MATSFDLSPIDVPITFVVGDQLDIGLAFTQVTSSSTPINLTGYTFESKVYIPTFSNPDGSLGSGAYTLGTTVTSITVSPVSLTGGTLSIGLTETQTAALNSAIGYRWYFRWSDTAGKTSTLMSGKFTARIP